jgi:tRNA (mo5U34)-methyltransferase
MSVENMKAINVETDNKDTKNTDATIKENGQKVNKPMKGISQTHWRAAFYQSILGTDLEQFIANFAEVINNWEAGNSNKETTRLTKQLAQLPQINETCDLLVSDSVALLSKSAPLNEGQRAKTEAVLKQFMPWRKGPFTFFDIHIDTEWRSDWKWERVLPHINNLSGKRVLDVGCGSGYHLFRMYQEGAKSVIGIDPTTLFFFQFQVFKQYLPQLPIHFLPIGIEHMPITKAFDTVFSMGVLYHRPDPIKFLKELRAQLSENGQLVLETLVIEGDENTVLVPSDRYAQMRNVWFIPSVAALSLWLTRVGFKQVKCVDIDVTSIKEQRATQWMDSQSLVDFLDPHDHTKTIEGYPAPMRAVLIAQ